MKIAWTEELVAHHLPDDDLSEDFRHQVVLPLLFDRVHAGAINQSSLLSQYLPPNLCQSITTQSILLASHLNHTLLNNGWYKTKLENQCYAHGHNRFFIGFWKIETFHYPE